SIKFLGQLSSKDTIAQISSAQLLLLPSEWFETFGLAVVEAFAVGTPAAVSNIGPLPSIVRQGINGVVFEAANPDSLLTTVQETWQQTGLLERLGAEARKSFENHYTEDSNYSQLMAIYAAAVARKRGVDDLSG